MRVDFARQRYAPTGPRCPAVLIAILKIARGPDAGLAPGRRSTRPVATTA
jgi:hypothetical protein